MKRFSIVGIGALFVNYIYWVDKIVTNDKAQIEKIVISTGGSAANTLFALSKFSLPTGFIGLTGDDKDGLLIRQHLANIGIDIDRIRILDSTVTGNVVTLIDTTGSKSEYYQAGVNSQLSPSDIDLNYLDEANMVHISELSDQSKTDLIINMVSKLGNTRISCAPGNMCSKVGFKGLLPILAKTHVLFLTMKELVELTNQTPNEGIRTCLATGCQILVLNLIGTQQLEMGIQSEKAAYIYDHRRELAIEKMANPKIVVDTTGVNDAFVAGFLYGFLRGKDLRQCGRLAIITADYCLSQTGATSGLPDALELLSHYREIITQP
jgi:ribokinase